jgi:hypothetical protein
MKPLTQLLGFIAALRAAIAGDHHAGGGHPGETGQPQEFPAYPHGPRRLLGTVNATVLTLEEAVATASTGDIWLFRGTSLGDRTIRAATNSQGTIDRDQEDRLMEVIDRFDGRPFPAALRLLRQRFTGRLHRSPSLETVFCAELVAATYQQMGLLPRNRPPSWYDPGRFWSGDRITLTPPYILGDEIAVR